MWSNVLDKNMHSFLCKGSSHVHNKNHNAVVNINFSLHISAVSSSPHMNIHNPYIEYGGTPGDSLKRDTPVG